MLFGVSDSGGGGKLPDALPGLRHALRRHLLEPERRPRRRLAPREGHEARGHPGGGARLGPGASGVVCGGTRRHLGGGEGAQGSAGGAEWQDPGGEAAAGGCQARWQRLGGGAPRRGQAAGEVEAVSARGSERHVSGRFRCFFRGFL